MKRNCKNCQEELSGREGKLFCSEYCRSAFNYQKKKNVTSRFREVDKQLRCNRKLLKKYNMAGKAVVRKEKILEEGFNPKIFTNYWKNKKGEVYIFCYEYGFFEKKENGNTKLILVEWQDYMGR